MSSRCSCDFDRGAATLPRRAPGSIVICFPSPMMLQPQWQYVPFPGWIEYYIKFRRPLSLPEVPKLGRAGVAGHLHHLPHRRQTYTVNAIAGRPSGASGLDLKKAKAV